MNEARDAPPWEGGSGGLLEVVDMMCTVTETMAPTSGKKEVTSTCYARGKDARLSGAYTATADLYCRNDAGTNKKALCCMPAGTKVHCYGYYSTANGVKWLYIQFELNGVTYTGFSSSAYLKKV